MTREQFYFTFGFVGVSLLLGAILMPVISCLCRRCGKVTRPTTVETGVEARKHFPPFWTGLFERFFFTLLLCFNFGGAGVAMMAWVAAKQLNNFQRSTTALDANAREWAFTSLVLSLVNFTFVLVGAIIATHWLKLESLMPWLETLVGNFVGK